MRGEMGGRRRVIEGSPAGQLPGFSKQDLIVVMGVF